MDKEDVVKVEDCRSDEKKRKSILVIVDPQNDFIEGGALPVNGGKKALDWIADCLRCKRYVFDYILITLDTHHKSNLAFKNPDTKLLKSLYSEIQVDKWPEHCIKDTHGWEIYDELWRVLNEHGYIQENRVFYFLKGEEDDKEAYSAFHYKGGEEIEYNVNTLNFNLLLDSDIYFAGLAEDYCVLETIKSVIELTKGFSNSYTLLKQGTRPITQDKKLLEEKYSEVSSHDNFFIDP